MLIDSKVSKQSSVQQDVHGQVQQIEQQLQMWLQQASVQQQSVPSSTLQQINSQVQQVQKTSTEDKSSSFQQQVKSISIQNQVSVLQSVVQQVSSLDECSIAQQQQQSSINLASVQHQQDSVLQSTKRDREGESSEFQTSIPEKKVKKKHGSKGKKFQQYIPGHKR